MDNEAQTTQIQDDNANIGAAEAHPKPMLTVDQQIAHMKAKGITFDLVSEAEAAAHLRAKCQFFRVYAYRRNFDRHVGGDRDGQYVGLDFGHLRVLSNLDRKLRDTLLPMALDLEHFAKVCLLAAAEDAGEDGYAVMRGYMASVTDKQRSHLEIVFRVTNTAFASSPWDIPSRSRCSLMRFASSTRIPSHLEVSGRGNCTIEPVWQARCHAKMACQKSLAAALSWKLCEAQSFDLKQKDP